jgi:dipeptidyl aminopeptidase/acylaminoacyl peptidase
MSTRRFELTDELLRTALAARAIRADDELTANLIDAQVLEAAASMRQVRRWPTFADLEFGRWTPVVVIALLLAALAVTIAIGSALLPRPDRPFPVTAANGQIVAWRSGQLQAVGGADRPAQTQLKLPSVTDATALAWAPDGERFAYAAPGGVWIVDVSDGSSAESAIPCGVDAAACAIDWSPDGSLLAVAQFGALTLVRPDGTDASTIVTFPGDHVEHPSWSPDSTRVAFVVLHRFRPERPEGRVLYVVNRDGSGLAARYGPSPDGWLGIWDPDWSPDGTQIAYIGSTPTASPTGAPPGYLQLNVTVIKANGTDPRVVLEDAGKCRCVGLVPGLAWSPDGTRIALVVPGAGVSGTALWVIDADGSDMTLLAEEVAPPLAWQPVPK